MSTITDAAHERSRRMQRREPLDDPFVITPSEAFLLANEIVAKRRSVGGTGPSAEDLYGEMIDGKHELYGMKLEVRGME